VARALATIATIRSLAPIPGADAIETARIRGWDVVVKKGEFRAGEPCVYVEIDSMLDVRRPGFEFLAARGVRTDVEGRTGHRLRTMKLRGQVSQGLALPVDAFAELASVGPSDGADVTEILGVWKWEPPLSARITGAVYGPLPGWIRKTDEERLQNMPGVLAHRDGWVATEKLDGTSLTAWVAPGEERDHGVCMRNHDLRPDDDNTLWAVVRRHALHDVLRRVVSTSGYVQGELYGEGIQANPLKVRGQHVGVFTVVIDGRRVPRAHWPAEVAALSVPVHDLPFPTSLDEALAQADSMTSNVTRGARAEGLVWRNHAEHVDADGVRYPGSFKVISNRYLLKRGDDA
jgi:RNA ligase (TIGR02306 family)